MRKDPRRAGRSAKQAPIVARNAPVGGPAHSYDIQNYKLTLDIYDCFRSPFLASYSGYEVVTVVADSTLGSTVLNAVNSSLIVDSVNVAATGFVHVNNLLTLTLDRMYNAADSLDVGFFLTYEYSRWRDLHQPGFDVFTGL